MGKKDEKKSAAAAAAAPSADAGKKSYLEMLKKPKQETPPPTPEPTPTTNGSAPAPAAKKQPAKPPSLDELPTLGGAAPVVAEKPVWGPKKVAPAAAMSGTEKPAAEKEEKPVEAEAAEAQSEAQAAAALNFKLVEAKSKKTKKGKHQVYEKDANGEAAPHEADAVEEDGQAEHQAEQPATEDAARVPETSEQEVSGGLSSTQPENDEGSPNESETEPKGEARPISPPVAQPTDAVVSHGVPPTESPFRRRSDPLDEEVPHRVEPVRAPVSPPTASVGRSKAHGNGSRMDWAASGWPLADGVDADSHYDVPTLPMPESRHSTPSQSAQRARAGGANVPLGLSGGASGWRWVEGGADLEFPPSVTAADQYYVRFAAPDSRFYDKEPGLNPRHAELAQRLESDARALEETKKHLNEERLRLEAEGVKLLAERAKIDGEKQALAQNQRKLKAEQDISRNLAEGIKREKDRLDAERAELEDRRNMMAQGLQLVLGPNHTAPAGPHHAPAPAPSHHRPPQGRGSHPGYAFDEPPQGSGSYGGGASSGMGSDWGYPNGGQYQDYGSYHPNGSYGASSAAASRGSSAFSSHPQAPQVQVGQPGMGRSGPIAPAHPYGSKAPGTGMRTARPMGEAHNSYARPGPPGVASRHAAGDQFHAEPPPFSHSQW